MAKTYPIGDDEADSRGKETRILPIRQSSQEVSGAWKGQKVPMVSQRATSSVSESPSPSSPGNAGGEPMESVALRLTSRMLQYRLGQGETAPTTAPIDHRRENTS